MNIKPTTKSDVCYSSRTYLHPSQVYIKLENPKHVQPREVFLSQQTCLHNHFSTARFKNEQIYSANKG